MNNFIKAFEDCKNSVLNLVNQNIEQQKEIKNISQFFSLIPTIIKQDQKDAAKNDIFQDITRGIDNAITQLQTYQKNTAEKIAADRLNSVRGVVNQNIVRIRWEQKTMLSSFKKEITAKFNSIQEIINQNFIDKTRSIATLLLQPMKFPSKMRTLQTDKNYFCRLWVLDHRSIAASGRKVINFRNRNYKRSKEYYSIAIYYTETNNSEKIERAHYSSILSVCLFGNLVLSSSYDNIIKVWERVSFNKFSVFQVINESPSYSTDLIYLNDNMFCSSNINIGEIKIWHRGENTFNCTKEKIHEGFFISILNLGDKIVLVDLKSLKISDIYSLRSETINGVYCSRREALVKLTDDQILLGGKEELFLVNIFSKDIQTFKDEEFEEVICLACWGIQKVLIENNYGMMICFDILSKQILSKQNMFSFLSFTNLDKEHLCTTYRNNDNYVIDIFS